MIAGVHCAAMYLIQSPLAEVVAKRDFNQSINHQKQFPLRLGLPEGYILLLNWSRNYKGYDVLEIN